MPPDPEGMSESEIVQYSLFIFILISYSVKVNDLKENYKKRRTQQKKYSDRTIKSGRNTIQ